MDQISTSDLLTLLLTQRGSIDLQFQFWLSITFAVGERWVNVLVSRGVDIGIPWHSAYLRMAVTLLGTVSALVFLFRHDRREGSDG